GTGPAFDLGILAFQVGGGLVGQQGGDLAGQLAERLGAVVGPAHQAELVLHQRMVDFDDLHAESLAPLLRPRPSTAALPAASASPSTRRGPARPRSSRSAG